MQIDQDILRARRNRRLRIHLEGVRRVLLSQVGEDDVERGHLADSKLVADTELLVEGVDEGAQGVLRGNQPMALRYA